MLVIRPDVVVGVSWPTLSRGVEVLQKCASPFCSTQFRYLNEGKLFEVEIQYGTASTSKGQREVGNGKAHIERWWLCDRCTVDTTLSYDRQRGLLMLHSLEGCDEVVTSRFERSSETAVADISRVLIRSLDIESKRSKVQIREAA